MRREAADACPTETALLPAPFWCTSRGTGPLRLALTGATRSGSAGVGSLSRDPLVRLRCIQVESIGTTINFRPAAITNRDIAASALLIASGLALGGGPGCVGAAAGQPQSANPHRRRHRAAARTNYFFAFSASASRANRSAFSRSRFSSKAFCAFS
jgi:hypothetical protein